MRHEILSTVNASGQPLQVSLDLAAADKLAKFSYKYLNNCSDVGQGDLTRSFYWGKRDL